MKTLKDVVFDVPFLNGLKETLSLGVKVRKASVLLEGHLRPFE